MTGTAALLQVTLRMGIYGRRPELTPASLQEFDQLGCYRECAKENCTALIRIDELANSLRFSGIDFPCSQFAICNAPTLLQVIIEAM